MCSALLKDIYGLFWGKATDNKKELFQLQKKTTHLTNTFYVKVWKSRCQHCHVGFTTCTRESCGNKFLNVRVFIGNTHYLRKAKHNIYIYYILKNEILENIDEIKCVFFYFHCKNLFFTAVKHIFRIFTGLLPDYFL